MGASGVLPPGYRLTRKMGPRMTLPQQNSIPTKFCSKCERFYPLDRFGKDNSRKGGIALYCKRCVADCSARSRARNPDRRAAVLARYRLAHSEAITNRLKEWVATHPERRKEISRTYQTNNREKRQRYYAENRAARLAYSRQYHRDHPEQVAATRQRRRARLVGLTVNDLTELQWKAILDAFDHRCAYCGQRPKRGQRKLAQDHITPIINMGLHTLSNIVPACASCNSKKAIGPPLRPVQPLLLC